MPLPIRSRVGAGCVRAGWLIVIPLLLAACSRAPATPGNYVRLQSPDKRFSIEHPENWDVGGNFTRGILLLNIGSGSVVCDIRSNALNQSLGGSGRGGGAVRVDQMPDELQPEAHAHTALSDLYRLQLPGYEELFETTLRTAGGRMRVSECRCNSFHGYRGTMIFGGQTISFLFQSPPGHWAEVDPVFMHMLESVAPYGHQ